jgi:hypothetical protein
MPPFASVPILLLLLITAPILAQEQDSLTNDRIASIKKLAREVKDDTKDFTSKMNAEATRRLQAIQQQEAKLEKHLPKEELEKALQLKDELNKKLDALAGITQAPDSLLKTMFKGQYFARFDSLETLFKFALPKTGDLTIIKDAESQIQRLKAELAMLDDCEKWLANREQQWKQLLSANPLEKLQLPKAFGKWQEEALAYKMQVEHYKETIKDPQKIETEALKLLNKLPAFQEFMSKNSELARLFGPPGGSSGTGLPQGTPIPGLQTRQTLAQELQNRFGANALQSGGALQQQLQNGMDQLSQQQTPSLQNILPELNISTSIGNGNVGEMTPKQQEHAALKSKTFKERVEFGWNLQNAMRMQDFPAIRDVGLSLGYKMNPRSVIGVGVAYKFALGESWKNVEWTHEGVGLRSFLDWRISSAGSKLLQNIWITGGFEINYWSRIANDVRWKDLAWEKSGLVGVTRKIKIGKKGGKIQILYDVLDFKYPLNIQNFKIRLGNEL